MLSTRRAAGFAAPGLDLTQARGDGDRAPLVGLRGKQPRRSTGGDLREGLVDLPELAMNGGAVAAAAGVARGAGGGVGWLSLTRGIPIVFLKEKNTANACRNSSIMLTRCSVKGELKLDRPLSNLRHLAVVWCEITRIELPILKLDTFVYHGDIVPIVINGDSMLENAQVWLFKENFDDAVRTVLNGIPRVQNLTLQILKPEIERQSLLNSTCMFSQLRCLQLLLGITLVNINKLPRVVSILRAAPSIEKLEIHFTGCGNHLCEAAKGTVDKPKYLEHCEYDYLKSVHMTGYKGARGQLEFLVHVVEKAPALEALTVDTALEIRDDYYVRRFCRKNACSDGAAVHARSCLVQ
ncbi:hypothetical protein D1007_13355 [Hordeum vulgare]|nr:hypothetical protein D1007_13355 [Hordeum vulgare]